MYSRPFLKVTEGHISVSCVLLSKELNVITTVSIQRRLLCIRLVLEVSLKSYHSELCTMSTLSLKYVEGHDLCES